MDIRVLGPVEASVGGNPIELGAPRQRCVLAVLALEPNRVVPVDRLIDAVWDTDLPAAPRTSVWTYVSRLRKVFADVDGVSLARRTGGYRLDIAPEAVDLHRFRALLAQARATPDLAAADRFFRDALALWRGAPLGDVRTSWLEQRICAGLGQEYLDAVEDQYACRLRLGAHAESISALRGIAAEHPRREKLAGLLMLALYRGGQKAGALDAYHRTAQHIAAELGLDPGADLRQLHEAILRDDPALADPSQPGPTALSTPTSTTDTDPTPKSTMDPEPFSVAPEQLPGDVAAFTGRQDELDRLDALHRDGSGNGGPATRGMRITAITGTAGVGKTSLALHWGHRAAAQFPDGTLYLDLRGFDDQQPPVEPADALRQLLTSIGVSEKNIPAGLDERSALFRSLLANRRALVVLDNARGSKQARPLLPGTPGCPVLVTSRTRLDGLVALDGAHQIALDSLAPHESSRLLAALLGTARIEAEPEAARELAARCDHLPLALRLASAQLGARKHRTIADFVEVLADHRNRLDTLDLLDLGTPLRATFDVSYRSLSADAALVFRVIGLHPGPDVDVHVLAAATGTRTTRIRRWLNELAAAHLVTEHARGRYAMHDLLRAYAQEKATDLPLPEQARTTERILDYYLHVAQAAKSIQYTGRSKPPENERPRFVPAETPRLDGIESAGAWFDAEWANVIAAVRHAAAHEDLRHTIAISLAMSMHFTLTHRWDDALTVGRIAQSVAGKRGDQQAEMRILNLLASAAYFREGPEQSIACFRQMHELAVAQGDHYVAGLSLSNLALALCRSGRCAEAAVTADQALTFISRDDDPWNWANTKNNLCNNYLRMGEPAKALVPGLEALAVFNEINDEVQQGFVMHTLGEAYLGLSRTDEARDHLERAIEVDRRSGNDPGLARAYLHLGDLERLLGHPDLATAHWNAAYALRKALTPHESDQLDERLGLRGSQP